MGLNAFLPRTSIYIYMCVSVWVFFGGGGQESGGSRLLIHKDVFLEGGPVLAPDGRTQGTPVSHWALVPDLRTLGTPVSHWVAYASERNTP
jgi:hypothetical protein